MTPFWRRRSSSRSDSDDNELDTPRRGDLEDDNCYANKNELDTPIRRKARYKPLPTVISMPEMSDIHDMLQFGEDEIGDVLHDEEEFVGAPPPEWDGEMMMGKSGDDIGGDDGFFIDSSDRNLDDDNNNNGGGFLFGGGAAAGARHARGVAGDDKSRREYSINSPDSVTAANEQNGGSGMGMRHAKSMVSLSSLHDGKVDDLVSDMAQCMDTVLEGNEQQHSSNESLGIHDNNVNKKEGKKGGPNEEIFHDSKQRSPTIEAEGGLDFSIVGAEYVMPINEVVGAESAMPTKGDGHEDSCCPSPIIDKSIRSTSTSQSMPIRSSFKGSKSSLKNLDESDHSKSSSSKAPKRNVSFGSLEIRAYDVTLGDAVTPHAISLDWKYDPSATKQHDIDEYELQRTDSNPRRSKLDFHMPPLHRQYILMREAGLTRREIHAAMVEAKRVAKYRVRNARGPQKYEEMVEKTRRKFEKMSGRRATVPQWEG